MSPWTVDEFTLRMASRLFTATRLMDYHKWSPQDKRNGIEVVASPHLLLSPMDYSSSQTIPLAFKPDSVYLLTVMRGDHSCPALFHHNRDHNGVLAYADRGLPGLPKSRSQVISVELKRSKGLRFRDPTCADSRLKPSPPSGIETEFIIVTMHKVASIQYHQWLPNDLFAPSGLVDVQQWMPSLLRFLDGKRKELQ